MTVLKSLVGKKYSYLTVVSRNYSKKRTYWNCICDCGNNHIARNDAIKSGSVKSCGKCYSGKSLTVELLKKLLSYDDKTGIFKREHILKSSKNRGNLIAGSISKNGYVVISINRKLMQAHRLAFLYMTGYIPEQIDHINHDKKDNRWCNLREVTAIENMKNQKLRVTNKSGITGITRRNTNSSWIVRLMHNYKAIRVGSYNDFFEACCAKKSAELAYGFHKNHGRNTEDYIYAMGIK